MTYSRDRIAGLVAAIAGVLALVALGLWQSGLIDRVSDTARFVQWMAAGRTPIEIERRPLAMIRNASTGTWAEGSAAEARNGTVYPGDLYRPPAADAGTTAPGIVLVPGASPGGKDEPLLVAFAEILAASGFTVLVPDLPGLRTQQVNPAHADDIAAAASFLSGTLDRRAVAVAAISYAVGPAVIALSRQDADRPIALLLGIGGYYDAIATVAYVTTGQVHTGDGNWQKRSPNEYGKWVFVWSNLPRIASHTDRATLEAMARRKFDDPAADIADLAATLGPEGRAVWRLLDNADPERVPALVGALPATVRTALDGLDLAQLDLSSIEATLLLVHGADDPILPPEGSIALASAVPSSELYLLESLGHVDLSLASLGDAWTLWQASWSLIGWRDRLAED